MTSPDFDDDAFHIDQLSGRVFLDKEIDADLLPSNMFLLKVNFSCFYIQFNFGYIII